MQTRTMKSAQLIIFILFYIVNCPIQCQKQPHFAGNRTTMVHLFEWTWNAIAKECEEFLGPNGYGGVQISPPNECRIIQGRPWWERYQPISYLLHSRSGNEAELQAMITRCNRAGVRVYVDAVINHMTGSQPAAVTGTAGSKADYTKRHYPAVPYGADDFNVPCEIRDYSDRIQVRNCQLSSLLDLNQGKPYVRDVIVGYLNKLIAMGVAGFRIDAAKHMWPDDLRAIYERLQHLNGNFGFSARPFIYQEVIDLGAETIKSTEYNSIGCVTEFKHSNELGRCFRGKNALKWLNNWGDGWSLLPSADALVFVDNHDNQRGHGAGGAEVLTHKNAEAYKMATIFMLAHPYGRVTRVMSSYSFESTDQGPPTLKAEQISPPTFNQTGQCLGGWICEHRWPAIVEMVKFRNIVGDAPLINWWDNGNNQVIFERAGRGLLAINMETAQRMEKNVKTQLPPGSYCNVLLAAGPSGCGATKLTVANDGSLMIKLPTGPSAMAIHINNKL